MNGKLQIMLAIVQLLESVRWIKIPLFYISNKNGCCNVIMRLGSYSKSKQSQLIIITPCYFILML